MGVGGECRRPTKQETVSLSASQCAGCITHRELSTTHTTGGTLWEGGWSDFLPPPLIQSFSESVMNDEEINNFLHRMTD